ncbi:hypothetical protein PAECIP111893_00254 [Paenibacillus plantiphilus]|uniref:Bacteriophage SP-beta YorD domain-containing protein n=1 Tax=Paenibacillus plantiphilus TaxID=2905650 RepID=A0ABN8FVV0_9BACL|nr:hypothetical protein [Paenibacillus plantiphilus]CAH1190276.1 hypothetical protein PAECIP111893_00254 [Paenibacillus plantiphilus]
MEHKHYYRLDEDGIVILAFSDAFQQPEEADHYVTDGGRHFNPTITSVRGQYLYKLVAGEIVERSQQELEEEWAARPAIKSPEQQRIEQLEADNVSLMTAMADIYEQLITLQSGGEA